MEHQRTSFSLALNLPWRNAEGAAYDGNGAGFAFTVGQTLPRRFFIEASYAYDSMSYDHPHPRSAAGECREDDTVSVGFKASWNVREDLTRYTGYRHTNNNSNIPGCFAFDQNLYSLGLVKVF